MRRFRRWSRGIRFEGDSPVLVGGHVCRGLKFRSDDCDLIVLAPKAKKYLRLTPVKVKVRTPRRPVRICRYSADEIQWTDTWRFTSGEVTLSFDGVPIVIEIPRRL